MTGSVSIGRCERSDRGQDWGEVAMIEDTIRPTLALCFGAFFRHFEATGRIIMQIVGLGDILESLEKYIGRRAAQVVAILAAAAFGAFCIASVFSVLLIPLYTSIVDLFSGPSDFFQAVGRVIGNVVWLVAVIAVTTNIANMASIARARKEWESNVDYTRDLLAGAEGVRSELKIAAEDATIRSASYSKLTRSRIELMKREVQILTALKQLSSDLSKIASKIDSQEARKRIESTVVFIRKNIPSRDEINKIEDAMKDLPKPYKKEAPED